MYLFSTSVLIVLLLPQNATQSTRLPSNLQAPFAAYKALLYLRLESQLRSAMQLIIAIVDYPNHVLREEPPKHAQSAFYCLSHLDRGGEIECVGQKGRGGGGWLLLLSNS